MADIKLLYGTKTNFDTASTKPTNVLGSLYLATVDTNRSYLYFGNGTNFLNIVPELLTVPNGGTGRTTLTSGCALIGNGDNEVNLRSITDNQTITYISASDNLITANTLANWNGSYDNTGNSSIQYLGTISKGVWSASTVDVSHGGTGIGLAENGFTLNGILYGNGLDPLQVTAAGTDGQIFSTDDGIPKFLTPTVSWSPATSDTTGPLVEFKLSGQNYTSPIPAASGETNATAAGIVTKGTQSFAGTKTFMGAVLTSNIYPRTNNEYTSGTSNSVWKTVYGVDYDVRDTNKVQVGRFASTTTGTASDTGVTSLYIGNNSASGAIGNSQGYIYIYSSSTGYTRFNRESGSSNYNVVIPNVAGNMLVSNTAVTNPTSETTYYLPFYITNYKKVSMNDGIRLISKQGTAAANGYSLLVLGNATAGGTAANKYGGIRMYSTTSAYNDIVAHPSTSTATIRLPAITKGAELIYHDMDTSIGSSDQAVYIGTDGKPAVVTTMAVSYGGTGRNTFTTNGVLYGNGIDGINITSAGNQGTILSPDSANVPSFATPTWTWTDGTSNGPTLTLTLQSKGWTTPAVPAASATTSGVVTTSSSTQTFAGPKTFSGITKVSNNTTSNSTTTGAFVVTGGVGIGGSLYANAISSTTSLSAGTSLTVGGAATIGGDLTVNGGEIYLGTTNEHCAIAYDADSNTLTISFPG